MQCSNVCNAMLYKTHLVFLPGKFSGSFDFNFPPRISAVRVAILGKWGPKAVFSQYLISHL